MDPHVEIIHCLFVFLVNDYLNVLLRNFLFFEILIDKLSSLIWRTIINVNNVIVVVVLHENRIQISEVKAAFNVIIRRSNDTERKFLLSIEIDVILIIVVLLVLFKHF